MEKEKRDVENNKKFFLKLGLIFQVTTMLVGPVVAGLFVGYWVDNFFHTTPLFLIVGVILGFVGSVVNVFEVMKISEKK